MNLIMLMIQKLKSLPSYLYTVSAIVLIGIIAYFDSMMPFPLFIVYLLPMSLAVFLTPKFQSIPISLISFAAYAVVNLNFKISDPSVTELATNGLLFLGIAFLEIALNDQIELNQLYRFQDELTGGLSKTLFLQRAEEELHRSHRYKRPITLAYLDCSKLKAVREDQSFKFEKEILQNIARIMKQNLRKTDLFTRIDEDNFLILLPDINAGGARTALQKIQSLIRLKSIAANWPLEFNIGAITFNQPPLDMQSVLESVSSMAHTQTDDGNFLQHQQLYN
ncbi:MAG: diguanylate cyclase [Caldisericaceae bacterium]|nr:diguanylate cyclase [Caldisericaceae bacterium]